MVHGLAETTESPVRAVDLSDWLLSRGRDHVTTPEAADLLRVPAEHVRQRMHRQVEGRKFFTPARGLWIPVPARYREWGVVPAEDFIDVLMTHLRRDYYVGWLSAASVYGATHQAPQVFQVAVSSHLADRDLGRVRLRFHTRSQLNRLSLVRRKVPSPMKLTGPALTALDLADSPRIAGGLSNAATVIHDLAEDISADDLSQFAPLFPVSTARRLGYLMTFLGLDFSLVSLQRWVDSKQSVAPTPLSPTAAPRGILDRQWSIVVNDTVEPDL